MSPEPFDLKSPPNLARKGILITGASVGAATLITHAGHNPSHLVFTGLSDSSAKTTIGNVGRFTPELLITFIQCGLANLASIETASFNIFTKLTHLEVLVSNAGIMAKPAAFSNDDYEMHFATNHFRPCSARLQA